MPSTHTHLQEPVNVNERMWEELVVHSKHSINVCGAKERREGESETVAAKVGWGDGQVGRGSAG